MDPFLTAILGGTIKSLATKAIAGPVEGLARKTLARVDGQPIGATTAAVRQAVEAARRDLVEEYWPGEDELSRDVVQLLEHPPFAEEVVRRLLFRGQPDLDRLRRAYLTTEGTEPDAASERWQELQPMLEIFFEVIEQHLEADPHLGPLLRDSRRLAALNRLESVVAEASRATQRYQRRALRVAEQGDDHLRDLVALTDDQTVTLSRIHELLEVQEERASKDLEQGAAGGLAAGLTPAEERYLRLLRRECNQLPLADDTRDVSTEHTERPELANVYIDLETRTDPAAEQILARLGVPEAERAAVYGRLNRLSYRLREGRGAAIDELLTPSTQIDDEHPLQPWVADTDDLAAARHPLTALEGLLAEPYQVLLGDPGSGKSTFVNHLAATLASRLLGEEIGSLETPSGALTEPWFPVRIVLRQWSAGLPNATTQAGQELAVLDQALSDLPGDVPSERWLERFADPKTLVLFDGLDEVPAGRDGENEIDRRRVIAAAVEAFRAAHPACRVLVTCRVKPYREGPVQLAGAPVSMLAPLDDERIRRFCHRWYDELARVGRLAAGEVDDRRERLLMALGERQVLRQMAGTPLLLTMLARVNARARLPESRVELYGECVEQLLWEWERQKRGVATNLADLLEEPSLKRAEFERVLWRLTWDAHGASGKDGTVDLPFAALREALAKIHPERDAGWAWANQVLELMRERGGLLVESQPDVFTFPHRSFQEYLACRWLLAQGNAPTTADRLATDDAWGEVILLSCGYLSAQGHSGDLQAIVAALVAGDEPEEPEAWRRVLLAGRAWHEFGPHRAEERQGEELVDKVPRLLTRLMQHPDLPPQQRLEAGLLAADLGALPDDLDAWIEIPADTLEYAFKIGKYPVTNAQYQRFVAAGGYDREKGWFSEEARADILRFEKWPTNSRLAKSSTFNRPTQPVTGVSWYEATAYTAWLTAELQRTGELGEDQVLRLATEAEWVRAAGGTEDRKYSWDREFEPGRANTEESQLRQPTPVHMYPAGATPEGVFDLTGNVREWIDGKSDDGACLLVGGAYWCDMTGVGAGERLLRDRYVRAVNVGFRVVVVPIARASS